MVEPSDATDGSNPSITPIGSSTPGNAMRSVYPETNIRSIGRMDSLARRGSVVATARVVIALVMLAQQIDAVIATVRGSHDGMHVVA